MVEDYQANSPEGGIHAKPVQRRLLVPLALVSLALVSGFVTALARSAHASRAAATQLITAGASEQFATQLRNQVEKLEALASVLSLDEELRQALIAKDQEELLILGRAIFGMLHEQVGLTHLYFHSPDRVNLMRVHQPERNGDIINRFTAREAERTGKIASGIELGPMGTFTLRCVLPIIDADTLVGYVELGSEIEEILAAIHAQFDVEMVATIFKDLLDQVSWEEGMAMLGRDAEWNRFPEKVLVFSSLSNLPMELGPSMPERGHIHGQEREDVRLSSGIWDVMVHPLIDASGDEVGDLLILHDISAEKASGRRTITTAIGLAIVLLSGLFGFLFVILRQTDRGIRNQQARLSASEERLELALKVANDGIWDWDLEQDTVHFDSRYYTMAGYEPGEFPSEFVEWAARVHPEDKERADAAIMEYLKGGIERYEAEFRFRKKDISWMWIAARGKAVEWNEKGDPLRLVGTHTDITDRKRAEEELRALNEILAEQTAHANSLAAEAEMANMAKSDFLANMSHEIRTPMNGVIGMTGLLLDTDLDDEQRRYVKTVEASANSLLRLINDILDFSKVEAGKLELEILDFDLRATLDDFAKVMTIKAQEKGLEFLCAASPEMPTLLQGDPGRLRQVLINLSGNAAKFTSEGEIAVRASLVSETESAALVRFAVQDTGVGIPAHKLDDLFGKFTQVDSSITREYGGSGLGLAISKQLVELMGGEIGVISEVGKGSEFWFTAHFTKQAEQERELPVPGNVHGARVLVVDDNATNREILLAQLKAWGALPTEAPDGESGLRLLREAAGRGEPYRVAILDFQMPRMGGDELGRLIKADAEIADVRMMMMTSVGKRGDARRFEEIGFAAYLTKPVRQSELLHGLALVLSDNTRETQLPLVTCHSIREIRRSSVRILVAEDNITNQHVALGILKKLGLSADAVANGADAVRALESIPYDLVLMDVQMPEMDGYRATARIRDPNSKVLNHGIPIIALTAHAMQGDRQRSIDAGMDDYLAKPVNPQALAEVLDRWLQKGGDNGRGSKEGQEAEKDTVTSTTPVFDRAGMLDRMMDDEDLARMVLDAFLADMPLQIQILKDSLAIDDLETSTRQAHTIKGSAANVGGEVLRETAHEMEMVGRAGDMDGIRVRIEMMERDFEQLKEEIERSVSCPIEAAIGGRAPTTALGSSS